MAHALACRVGQRTGRARRHATQRYRQSLSRRQRSAVVGIRRRLRLCVADLGDLAGNFGGASIFLVKGANASPAENAQPNATTPLGSSFSVTFTAEASDIGDWTVVGLLPGSECGDSAPLTVTAAPNTAISQPSAVVTTGFFVLVLGVALGIYGLARARRRA